jgi:hypothetical protein
MNQLVERAGGKASAVIRAMCDGLEANERRDDFKIRMSTFGLAALHKCFGCAATCAVMQISGHRFTPAVIASSRDRAKELDLDWDDVEKFEMAIDRLRAFSRPQSLMDLCEVPVGVWIEALNDATGRDFRDVMATYELRPESRPWLLNDHDWQEQLPIVRRFADALEAVGY